jgi:hypothetical protein
MLACGLAFGAVLMPVQGQQTSMDRSFDESALDLGQVMMMAGGTATMSSDASAYPDFKDVTKDMESVGQDSLFKLWRYKAGAKDKDQETLYCQIPSGMLGEKFMLSLSFSGGGFFTGFPLEERVVQWEELDRQLLLVEPETHYVVNDSSTVSDVVKRTHPERIRAAVPIVTKSPSGDPVIDLGPLLKSNFADIAWMSGGGLFGFGGGSINTALSKWNKVKAFELNVELGVELAVSRMSPPGSYDKKLVHYSFWKLPKTDYTPRQADDRVGYFLTANQDWSKPTDERDIFNRYIDRWNLQKRDPSLELCEPKQPIVFYIEKTVPIRFRRAVRDGILEWNKAYEQIGFLNAVEVRQQTDTNEWKDLDPEDMRYSFFRWIVAGVGFAMGPHRANPFTGEIYDADIIFDDAMVRHYEQVADFNLSDAAMSVHGFDPALDEFLEQYPQFAPKSRSWERFEFVGEDAEKERTVRDALFKKMRQKGRHCCDYSQGMMHQVALGRAMLSEAPAEVREEFLYDIIKEVVMHEVGHTLGLRHNFKASSIYSVDEIKERRLKGEATTGSVMDYNPVLFFKDALLKGDYITPVLGPYDYWAIEYGYRPADGKYKSDDDSKADDKADEEGEDDGDEEVAANDSDEEPSAEEPEAPASTTVMIRGKEIPQEALDKMPPQMREMLLSGKFENMMKRNMGRRGGGMRRGMGRSGGGGGSTSAMFKSANPGESKMLADIAARSTEPQLAYATDEDTTSLGPDPKVYRFDLGSDAVDWARERINLVDSRMDNILDWAVKDQESWYHLRGAFMRLLIDKSITLNLVGRYAGGQYFHRHHRGAAVAPAPFEIVDPKQQRAALDYMTKTVFSDDFFTFSPELLNHLAPARWWHQGASVEYTMDFPISDLVSVLQWYNLFGRLHPNTLRRIYDAEHKSDDPSKMTAAEYIQTIQQACWGDTVSAKSAKSGSWTDAKPYIPEVRRSLQREYLYLMEQHVRIAPGMLMPADIHAMLQHSLRELKMEIEETLKSSRLDFASDAHLESCKSRIERILSPELREFGF